MGAIVPQRRISKTRKRQRRSHFHLDNPSMMVCPNCGEVKQMHCVCPACGYYDGKVAVLNGKVVKEEKKAAAPAKKAPTKKAAKK